MTGTQVPPGNHFFMVHPILKILTKVVPPNRKGKGRGTDTVIATSKNHGKSQFASTIG